MLRVVVLGSGGSMPSPNRGMPAIAIKELGKVFLFDCGENTQQQLMKAHVSYFKIEAIFLSHLHGDHVLGLPGLLQTMQMMGRTEKLTIIGPKGTREFVDRAINLVKFNIGFEVDVRENEKYERTGVRVEWFPLKHRVECNGYVFSRVMRRASKEKMQKMGLKPGRWVSELKQGKEVTINGKTIKPEDILNEEEIVGKVVIVFDTVKVESIIENARDADLLVCEGTFVNDEERAKKTMHMNVEDAIEIAKEANVKRLVITHVSNRYAKQLDEIEKEYGVKIARDFDEFLI